MADKDGARVDGGLEGIDDGSSIIQVVLLANRPTACQSRVTGKLNLEKIIVQLIESAVRVIGGVKANTESVEIVKEGLDKCLQLRLRLVDSDNGADVQQGAKDLVVDVETIVNPGGRVAVENADGLPDLSSIASGVGRGDVKVDGGAGEIVESFVGSLDDHAKGRRTAATKSPEKIRVMLSVGDAKESVGCDNLELKRGIRQKALSVGPRAVATTLRKTSSNTDGSTLTRHHDLLGVLAVEVLQSRLGLDTGADGNGGAGITSRARPLVGGGNLLEVAGVDN